MNAPTKAQKELERLLTPEELLEKPDPLEGTPEGLCPDELRAKPDDPSLEPDPLGLTPDNLRKKKDDPSLEPDPLGLTPDNLRKKKDDPSLEPDPLGLTPDELRKTRAEAEREKRIANGTATPADLAPDELRGGDDEGPGELPAKAKSPLDQISDDLKAVGEAIPKLDAAGKDLIKREAEAEEAERVSIREWFTKQEAERDLTPDR